MKLAIGSVAFMATHRTCPPDAAQAKQRENHEARTVDVWVIGLAPETSSPGAPHKRQFAHRIGRQIVDGRGPKCKVGCQMALACKVDLHQLSPAGDPQLCRMQFPMLTSICWMNGVCARSTHLDSARATLKDRVHETPRGHDGKRQGLVRRRRYGAELKAQVLATCEAPGASVAKVAMAHGINVVHRWRQLTREGAQATVAKPREFVPVAIAAPTPLPVQSCRDIEVELRRGTVTMKVLWPSSAAADFAAWTRELLR